jgi:hypothetical protein
MTSVSPEQEEAVSQAGNRCDIRSSIDGTVATDKAVDQGRK